jgi:hypothetical protein
MASLEFLGPRRMYNGLLPSGPLERGCERQLGSQTDVSANKMPRSARMAAITGRAAAFLGGGQWRQRAENALGYPEKAYDLARQFVRS